MTSLWFDGYQPVPALEHVERRSFDVVVVGAGITGLATAVMLAERGRDVAVIESRHPGALATGNSTAKVSLLQGTKLSRIARHHPDSLVTAYALANLDGQSWLLEFCRSAGVAIQVRPAITYAEGPAAASAVLAEYTVARRLGLDVEYRPDAGLPFATVAAVVMDDQFQLDPVELVTALVDRFVSLGGTLITGVTATGATSARPVRLSTDSGDFGADQLVIATGTPFLDRGLYFAKTEPRRSYALAFEVDEELSPGMYLSVDQPTRSLREAWVRGRHYLLVGGNGHVVGRSPSPADAVADLEKWTGHRFAGARLTHSWSAQDYHSNDEIPFIGVMPRTRGRVWFATGYDKWGLSNGPAAALRIVAEILGDEPPRWATVTGRRMTVPADLAEGIVAGAGVARSAVAGWVASTTGPADTPAEGRGIVSPGPVATSTVDGVTCRLSAVCPHLGGVVSWNDAERSWDCPLHGSRFAADGTRLEGPATRGLAPSTGSGTAG